MNKFVYPAGVLFRQDLREKKSVQSRMRAAVFLSLYRMVILGRNAFSPSVEFLELCHTFH